MYLKKYQIKQIKRYRANKTLLSGLNSKRIWLILSIQNLTTFRKQLTKIKNFTKYKYLINSQLNDFLKIKKEKSYLKTVTLQVDSFYSFENLVNLIRKTTSVPKYFIYNNNLYDYTFFYKYKNKNSIKNFILPLKIKRINNNVIINLIKTINYTKC